MRLSNSQQLSIEFHRNGSPFRLQHRQTLINSLLANGAEAGLTNLFLRLHRTSAVTAIPLFGPESPSEYQQHADRCLSVLGDALGVSYRLQLLLAESSTCWFFHLEVENRSATDLTAADLIYTQDLALADYGMVRLNEHFVSQYLDHQPLLHPQAGVLLASRQNLSMGGKHPWLLIGSLTGARLFATDALQIAGRGQQALPLANRLATDLPGSRLQHEHAMAALQSEEAPLTLGMRAQLGFFAWFEADHPAASSEQDFRIREQALALPEAVPLALPGDIARGRLAPPRTLFSLAQDLRAEELTPAELDDYFGDERRLVEFAEAGEVLSFYTADNRHVVLQAKERRVLRPHGMILRTGSGDAPDEAALTSTVWMSGVFNAMVCQGHVSINRFLSTTHSYLGLFRSYGQRIFVEVDGSWFLLGTPSAFEMALSGCRWIYKFAGGVLQVENNANLPANRLELDVRVLAGPERRFLISNHCALGGDDGLAPRSLEIARDANGIFIAAPLDSDVGTRFPAGGFYFEVQGDALEAVGGDELLFEDGQSQDLPFISLITKPASSFKVSICGNLVSPERPQREAVAAADYWTRRTLGLRLQPPAGSPLAQSLEEIAQCLPWYTQNAYVHYLAPRGLEQYSGGGWGTRDVAQGPLELLLALDNAEAVRDVLCRVFRQQNADGDWPQWFMFFDRERNIRPGDSHGDIVFWPLLAAGEYLLNAEDRSFLDQEIPFFHPEGDRRAEKATVLAHIKRALSLISSRCVPGTALISYGDGDWNDSLQPFDERLKEELVSTWTVTLHYQTLTTLQRAFRSLELVAEADELQEKAAAVLSDFRAHLLVDGVLTGYLRTGERPSYLIHPQDADTGLHYSLLPYIHAVIAEMLSPEEASRHFGIISQYLLAADGARLFDKPLEYRGGLQKHFQRAESSSFFGREIGLMYTHAHLRYAQALAKLGEVERFFDALLLANPLAVSRLVPSAALRQSNCYYSSSDAAFADRYAAYEQYHDVYAADVEFEGGWRVYSSGGGIFVGLVHGCLFGIRLEGGRLLLDPVLPKALNGLVVRRLFRGEMLEIAYHIDEKGYGPYRIVLDGKPLSFSREPNPYRPGGASIALGDIDAALQTGSRLEVFLR